jgi:hypothetical protein
MTTIIFGLRDSNSLEPSIGKSPVDAFVSFSRHPGGRANMAHAFPEMGYTEYKD